jgi:hypothetical protein
MAIYRGRPIDDLVAKLDLVMPDSGRSSMARSAIAQARARLGDEPLRWLFERCSKKWAHESARRHEWRGLALYGVDGTSARIPDSTENRSFFGDHCASGYPLVRIVTLMALRSHLLAAATFGPYGDELKYARELWPKLPDNSLAIVDRNFLAAHILIPIASSGGRHWLTRAKSKTTWEVTKNLGPGDDLVQMKVNAHSRAKDPSLPAHWHVRVIEYRRPGFPPQKLLTSLLDATKYPAAEIIALYHERWEIELGYGEVKTDMLERQEAIRSKTPKGVLQELWAIGLAYNLVRLEMERIADEAGVLPNRISFTMSLRLIRDEWMWAAASGTPGAIPKNLRKLRDEILRFVLPPRRTTRLYPREVKIKASSYDVKRPGTAARARK